MMSDEGSVPTLGSVLRQAGELARTVRRSAARGLIHGPVPQFRPSQWHTPLLSPATAPSVLLSHLLHADDVTQHHIEDRCWWQARLGSANDADRLRPRTVRHEHELCGAGAGPPLLPPGGSGVKGRGAQPHVAHVRHLQGGRRHLHDVHSG